MAVEEHWRDDVRLRRFEGGVLEVGVDSSSLRDELENFHRARLMSVLRAALPDTPLVGLRFIADPVDGDGV